MADTGYWGSTDMVFQCLIDKKRATFLGEVVTRVVQKNDVVVDLGTGSGILALYAVGAGARKVYAVETDLDLCKTLRKTIAANKLESRIIILEADATKVKLPEKVDVVLCEMVATCLIDELQVPVMNNIHQYCKPITRVIPESIDNYFDLVDVDQNFYGHIVKIVQYEYGYIDESGRRKPQPMSKQYLFKQIDFSKPINDTHVSIDINLEAAKTGIINGLRFSDISHFPDGSQLGGTPAYSMPLIIPIDEIHIKKGDKISVKVNYELCSSLHNLKFSVTKSSD